MTWERGYKFTNFTAVASFSGHFLAPPTWSGNEEYDPASVCLLVRSYQIASSGECGELYEYTVPSFPVISVELRRMKYESIMPNGKSTKVVDGFIREDTSLKRSFPADITIGEGYRHACIVPVSFARWHIFRSLGPEFAASRIAWPMI